jgi:hydrogenase 3 maturation protease
LPSSWKTLLNQLLEQQVIESDTPSKIAIVGIGNNLRSDDAAGILVAQRLMQSRCVQDLKHVLVIDAGHAPENMTGELRRFMPDVVLLVDAAEMGEMPGTARWIPMEDLDGMSASTHSMPLSMLAGYLTLELHCDVALLGIQPSSNDFGENVSLVVLQAVDEIVKEMERSLW